MPIYEFICLACGNEFERYVQKSSGTKDLLCPKCNSSRLEEKISSFASVSTGGSSNASNCAPSGG